MKWVLFYHSLLSDWNHGNAHFLRGVVRELRYRGHTVTVMEPRDGWSRRNLIAAHGPDTLEEVEELMNLTEIWRPYDEATLDLGEVLEDADVVIAHEWNSPDLIKRLGEYRRRRPSLRLLFHDTHHRAVSRPEEMEAYCFDYYDGALVFGRALKEVYDAHGWARETWVWHEAADARWFYPREQSGGRIHDFVWIGNWGDDERAEELREYLFRPARELALDGSVHGVRYPAEALRELEASGLRYNGWLPNHRAPEVYARHAFTVHIPRRFYVESLPGIPTIRVFEALACGIPLICSPWHDSEGLFQTGEDFLMVADAREMREAMHTILTDSGFAARLVWHGLHAIQSRHTCAHRVEELESIVYRLDGGPNPYSTPEKIESLHLNMKFWS